MGRVYTAIARVWTRFCPFCPQYPQLGLKIDRARKSRTHFLGSAKEIGLKIDPPVPFVLFDPLVHRPPYATWTGLFRPFQQVEKIIDRFWEGRFLRRGLRRTRHD